MKLKYLQGKDEEFYDSPFDNITTFYVEGHIDKNKFKNMIYKFAGLDKLYDYDFEFDNFISDHEVEHTYGMFDHENNLVSSCDVQKEKFKPITLYDVDND